MTRKVHHRLLLAAGLLVLGAEQASATEAKGSCPTPAPPMISLAGVTTFYRDTPGQSQIDPARFAEYTQRTAAFDRLLDVALQIGDGLAKSDPAQAADCALDQLYVWAEADALSKGLIEEDGVERRQGVMTQVWTVSAMTTLLDDLAPALPGKDHRLVAVLAWLERRANDIHEEFTPDPDRADWLNATSNHSNWAGLAMARVGGLTGNSSLISAGIGELAKALDVIDEQGALPPELARGKRALSYTNFAMLPISGLARFAISRGYSFSEGQMDALMRAAAFALRANMTPAVIAQMTGEQQEIQNRSEALAWLEVLQPIIALFRPDLAEETANIIATEGPFRSRFYGAPNADQHVSELLPKTTISAASTIPGDGTPF